jgi:hypothetical protein
MIYQFKVLFPFTLIFVSLFFNAGCKECRSSKDCDMGKVCQNGSCNEAGSIFDSESLESDTGLNDTGSDTVTDIVTSVADDSSTVTDLSSESESLTDDSTSSSET